MVINLTKYDLPLKSNTNAIQKKYQKQFKKKEKSFLRENGKSKIEKPNERVTDSNRSTLGYTFQSNTNFSIDKTQEKKYFN